MANSIREWQEEMKAKGFHKCLLCPCYIITSEVYCSSCSQDVWATRNNAEDHGGKYAKKWKKLWEKIKRAKKNER